MSDITNSRRASEYLDAHELTDHALPGENLIKAAVHASLASARALRELDSTTRQVNRLTADSIDELSADLVRRLSRPPALIQLNDVCWVNPAAVSVLRRELVNGKPNGNVVLRVGDQTLIIDEDVDTVAQRLLGAVA